MIKEKKIHAQRLEQFNQAYGSINSTAHELVSKMSDGGKPDRFRLGTGAPIAGSHQKCGVPCECHDRHL